MYEITVPHAEILKHSLEIFSKSQTPHQQNQLFQKITHNAPKGYCVATLVGFGEKGAASIVVYEAKDGASKEINQLFQKLYQKPDTYTCYLPMSIVKKQTADKNQAKK